jgi:hypothetical protein
MFSITFLAPTLQPVLQSPHKVQEGWYIPCSLTRSWKETLTCAKYAVPFPTLWQASATRLNF